MDDQSTMAAPEQPQQDCPFMKLPTELRIRIYAFALQHIMDKITTDKEQPRPLFPLRKPEPYKIKPFYSGTFALSHTSRTLRAESLDTLASRMLAHIYNLDDEARNIAGSAVLKRTRAMREDFDFEALQNALSQVAKLGNSAIQVKWICYTMAWTKGG